MGVSCSAAIISICCLTAWGTWTVKERVPSRVPPVAGAASGRLLRRPLTLASSARSGFCDMGNLTLLGCQLVKNLGNILVKLLNFKCPLPFRVDLLWRLSQSPGIAEDGATADGTGANRKAMFFEIAPRLFMPGANPRHGVENGNGAWKFSELQYLLRAADGFEVVGLGAAGDQHKIGDLRGGKGGLFGARGRVDDDQINIFAFEVGQSRAQSGWLNIDDGRSRCVGQCCLAPV